MKGVADTTYRWKADEPAIDRKSRGRKRISSTRENRDQSMVQHCDTRRDQNTC